MAETSDTEQSDKPDQEQSDSSDQEQPDAPDQEQLDELGSRIDRARSNAEDAVEGVATDEDEDADDEDEREFVESGATESEDDQTAAPPG
jgi:hypothetical protein